MDMDTDLEIVPHEDQNSSPQLNITNGSASETPPKDKGTPPTPKTSKRKETKAEREARKLAKEKEKEERRLKLEKEKEEKRLKLEKEKKEREEKKKQIEMEKEERKRKMETERQVKREKEAAEREAKRLKLEEEKLEKQKKKQEKEEEKQKKEEERLKKLDEKRQAEEEKQRKLEEEKHKQQRNQEKFLKYFKKSSEDANRSAGEESFAPEVSFCRFKPFQAQPFQTLAELVPQHVKQRFQPSSLDEAMKSQDFFINQLYLHNLKSCGKPEKVRWSSRRSSEDEIQIVSGGEKSKVFKQKAKLFQFDEDVRPAYFGTWRKTSGAITGRKPFAKDEKAFNYEVDSEAEWEEEDEVQGESLKDSDSESEGSANEGENYEYDEWFVPHGYLSDEEKVEEEEGVDKKPAGPLATEEIILNQRKKPLKKLKPVVIGCKWRESELEEDPLLAVLEEYRVTYLNL